MRKEKAEFLSTVSQISPFPPPPQIRPVQNTGKYTEALSLFTKMYLKKNYESKQSEINCCFFNTVV